MLQIQPHIQTILWQRPDGATTAAQQEAWEMSLFSKSTTYNDDKSAAFSLALVVKSLHSLLAKPPKLLNHPILQVQLPRRQPPPRRMTLLLQRPHRLDLGHQHSLP